MYLSWSSTSMHLYLSHMTAGKYQFRKLSEQKPKLELANKHFGDITINTGGLGIILQDDSLFKLFVSEWHPSSEFFFLPSCQTHCVSHFPACPSDASADEKRKSAADSRDNSFVQTKEVLSVSVKALSALYMSKVANREVTISPKVVKVSLRTFF